MKEAECQGTIRKREKRSREEDGRKELTVLASPGTDVRSPPLISNVALPVYRTFMAHKYRELSMISLLYYQRCLLSVHQKEGGQERMPETVIRSDSISVDSRWSRANSARTRKRSFRGVSRLCTNSICRLARVSGRIESDWTHFKIPELGFVCVERVY